MSDLIRKSDVLDLLYGIFDKYKMSTDKNTSIGKSFGTDVFEEIRNMPTAYDIDEVVEKLEEMKAYAVYEDINTDTKWLDKAIEIVKQGGVRKEVEYMNTTEEYKGCRNCKYQPEPMQTCDWIKHQKEVYRVCPMWELKENKGGGVDDN